MTLRDLLIQRAARLQEYPALTAPPWGGLLYPAFRNRVEGVALGLVGLGEPAFHGPGGTPWDWVCEVACACCGFEWDPRASQVDPAILGGCRFNDEAGRQPYHDRDHHLREETPFFAGLDHGEILRRLRRLNGRLGWDHTTALTVPLAQAGTPCGRAALWSLLYAGGHAILAPGAPWDPSPFHGFWD